MIDLNVVRERLQGISPTRWLNDLTDNGPYSFLHVPTRDYQFILHAPEDVRALLELVEFQAKLIRDLKEESLAYQRGVEERGDQLDVDAIKIAKEMAKIIRSL